MIWGKPAGMRVAAALRPRLPAGQVVPSGFAWQGVVGKEAHPRLQGQLTAAA